jgi:addiction module HigA family antidote
MAKPKKLAPIPPGEMLRDVLNAASLSANAAGLKMRIPNNRLSAILNGQRAITPDTALRLARLFGTSAELWMNLPMKYDLEIAGSISPSALPAKASRSRRPDFTLHRAILSN